MNAVTSMTLDLRAEGLVGVAALGAIPALNEEDRAAAIATWKGRMVNEHISARVFAALIPQLMRAGVAPNIQAKFADAIAEEMSHGRQCAAVVTALGGEAFATVGELSEVPTHADATPVEAVLRNVLSISCLSETVAVALIGAERLRAGVDGIQDALANILADEVRHARVGWSVVEDLAPGLDDPTRVRLDRYIVIAFRHLLAHELAHLPTGPAPSELAESVGVCDGREGRTLFFDTVETVIIPRLESLGFAAQSAWQRAGGTELASEHRNGGMCAKIPSFAEQWPMADA